jgi:hypothetical protein
MNQEETLSPKSRRATARQISGGLIFAFALISLSHDVFATPNTVKLGSDTNFAVLAGSGMSITGPTAITGDIGTYPIASTAITGSLTLNGANQSANTGVMVTAKNDFMTAFNDAAGRTATASYSGVANLGGLTLNSGVYDAPDAFDLTGTLILNGQGNFHAVWIFQTGSLATAPDFTVDLEDGAQACHVFWEVGGSATLGADTDFDGTILAYSAITANAGATVNGQLLALTGAVSLDDNVITTPIFTNSGGSASVRDTASTIFLLGIGTLVLIVSRRRLSGMIR